MWRMRVDISAEASALLVINDLTRHQLEAGFSASMQSGATQSLAQNWFFMASGSTCHEECGPVPCVALGEEVEVLRGTGGRAGNGVVCDETHA
jgi:hypothetical protein